MIRFNWLQFPTDDMPAISAVESMVLRCCTDIARYPQGSGILKLSVTFGARRFVLDILPFADSGRVDRIQVNEDFPEVTKLLGRIARMWGGTVLRLECPPNSLSSRVVDSMRYEKPEIRSRNVSGGAESDRPDDRRVALQAGGLFIGYRNVPVDIHNIHLPDVLRSDGFRPTQALLLDREGMKMFKEDGLPIAVANGRGDLLYLSPHEEASVLDVKAMFAANLATCGENEKIHTKDDLCDLLGEILCDYETLSPKVRNQALVEKIQAVLRFHKPSLLEKDEVEIRPSGGMRP